MKAAGVALKFLQSLCDRLPKDPSCRRVLLDVKNTVTASYLEDFRQLFAKDSRIKFYKVTGTIETLTDRMAAAARVHCPEVGFRIAHLVPWDLVVMADHPRHGIGDPARFPILRISHGIGGKMVNGQDYFYGPRIYRPDGKLRYSCIFEASHQRRSQFVAGNPQLEAAVRVVGDLKIDQLRAAMLAAKPAPTERPKVVIASSWNPHNLLETHGRFLLEQARALRDRYEVIIRPHPHFFKADASPIWKEYFADVAKAGIALSHPGEELGEVLASASVVICDDLSSVALYSVVLGRPMILSSTGSAQVAPKSFLGRLGKIVPNLRAADSLEHMIERAMQTPLSPEFIALAEEINSRPGQAATLMRAEVYQLLHLAPQLAGARSPSTDPAALAMGRLA